MIGIGLLGLAAMALLIWPSRGAGRTLGGVAALLVVGASALIYTQIGRPDLMSAASPAAMVAPSSGPERVMQGGASTAGAPDAAQDVTPDQIVQMVDALAQRLQTEPDNIEGWVLLGRSYMQMGQFGRAAEAFGQARARIPTPEDELDLSYAEARILNDQGALTGPPGEIVERVLAAHPNDVRASLYGGLRALALNDEALAISRFASILAMDVPDDLREVVEARLASIAAGADGVPSTQGGADAQVATTEGGPNSVNSPPSGPTFDAIRVEVGFAAGVSDQAQASALAEAKALFVFARAPAGGPPLAVKRLDSTELPREVELTDADAMLSGNRLSVNSEAILVARLSMSGMPTGGAGDWVAEMPVRAPVEAPVRLELKPPQQ